MTISLPVLFLRLFLALFLGGLIGWERDAHEHNAGIRTSALVALGTALFTVVSAYGFNYLLGEPHVQIDPTRIASYIVAGIGFLGGGAIFFRQDIQKVRGLTSAASVWVVAAIAMACGIGLLLEAIAVTLMTLFVLIGLRYVEARFLPSRNQHLQVLSMRISTDDEGLLLGLVYDVLRKCEIGVESVSVHTHKESERDVHYLTVECRCKDRQVLIQAIDQLKAVPAILSLKTAFRHEWVE